MAKLVMILPDGTRTERVLGEVETIGRSAENTIQVGDRIISKAHASVTREDRGFVLRDLSSLSGTFVRGERIGEHVLEDGDELVMGATRFVFSAAE